MSPAARLKHARHALAGILVPATWLALGSAARAEEAPPATTTTTEAPAATTTTTAPPPTTTTTTAPLPKKVQQRLKGNAEAQAFLATLDEGEDAPAAAVGADPAGNGPPVGSGPSAPPVAVSRPAPPSISVEDVLAGFDRRERPTRAAPGEPTAPPGATVPVPLTPFTGLPTDDGPGQGTPVTGGGFAFVSSPAPVPLGGGTDLISGTPSLSIDPALGGATGGAPAVVLTSGAGTTGQGENPERGPPAAAITTGDATATGNHAVTTIDQTTLIAVTSRGYVSLTTAENRDTGASWMSATLPSGLLGGRSAQLSALGTGTFTTSGSGSATITTGDALAIGNWSDTTINQKTIVAVTANGEDLVISQPASVANVGSATATTGGNTALGTNNQGTGSAVLTTGNATAYGNRSVSVINQSSTIAVTGSNSHVTVVQTATVDNIGTAVATTGDNTAIGTTGEGDGSAVIRTGDAIAVGNESTTTINQVGIAVATGKGSTADIDQQADVNNIGTATASTGGNTAVATSGGSTGSVLITTGNADATGNRAQTTITQTGISIATGRFAGTSITQGAGVINAGTAVGVTGINVGIGAG
jgi:hypothetical protein